MRAGRVSIVEEECELQMKIADDIWGLVGLRSDVVGRYVKIYLRLGTFGTIGKLRVRHPCLR